MASLVLCLVVGISDGDTLKAKCGEPGAHQQVTIRLAEVDAPEKGLLFGREVSLLLDCRGHARGDSGAGRGRGLAW